MSMVDDVTTYIKKYDPEVGAALEQELGRRETESGADCVGKYRNSGCNDGDGDGADEQVCRRISGETVLRRM